MNIIEMTVDQRYVYRAILQTVADGKNPVNVSAIMPHLPGSWPYAAVVNLRRGLVSAGLLENEYFLPPAALAAAQKQCDAMLKSMIREEEIATEAVAAVASEEPIPMTKRRKT